MVGRIRFAVACAVAGASGHDDCDINACFDRCDGKYGGHWDEGGDSKYCSKACADIKDSKIQDADLMCDQPADERYNFCLSHCDSDDVSKEEENKATCRWGCGYWQEPSPTPSPTPSCRRRRCAPTPSPTPSPTPTPPSPHSFPYHPGVLVTDTMLDKIKKRVKKGDKVMTEAVTMKDLVKWKDHKPKPQKIVDCGYDDKPDNGCTEEKDDVEAAYANALMWAATGDEARAQKAIEIMDAWSDKLEEHTNKNSRLQAGWCGSPFTRAAEIIKHHYGNWPNADRFGKMLTKAYLKKVQESYRDDSNGNWDLIMTETAMSIAVFTEDQSAWDKAVDRWKHRAPRYLYLESDGSKPKGYSSQSWHGLTYFKDGVCQETCRDFQHTQYGIMAMINAAETAWHQGLDLYGKEAARMLAGLEFHAKILVTEEYPKGLCHSSLKTDPTWEVAYNHFHGRRGESMKYTKQLLEGIRPTGAKRHMEFETLTHYAQDYDPSELVVA